MAAGLFSGKMNSQPRDVRESDRQRLRSLLDPASNFRVVLVRGDAGAGKTTLLTDLAEAGVQAGWRVLRATGSVSEAALSLAGLHQLLRPLLDAVIDLPASYRLAFDASFGLAEAAQPAGPLQLYLSCLTLLSQQSERTALLLMVDDAQWIDQATHDVLSFVARRLADDPIALVISSRGPVSADLGPDSRTIDLAPLTAQQANQLLNLQPTAPAGRVRAAILKQADGNPLALVELARVAAGDPAAAIAWQDRPMPLSERLRQSFSASARALPEQTQHALLLAAAADSEMNLSYLSGRLGVPAEAWDTAEAAGLITIDSGSVVFAHPLIRSAVYQAASPTARSSAHRTLAAALHDRPDEQARQLAAATTGPDQPLAKRLELIAESARARSRYDSASAAFQRAAELSPSRRTAGALLARAAEAASWMGQVDRVVLLAERVLDLTDEPSVRSLARQLLGWAGSLTLQFAKTVDLMTSLATDLTGKDPVAWEAARSAAAAAYFSGEDTLRARVLAMLDDLNGGLPWWRATAGSGVATQVIALWCATALEPETDRTVKVNAIRELAGRASPEMCIALGAAALMLDEARLAVTFRDQLESVPALLDSAQALTVIVWSLLDTGQWDDCLEYAGRARALATVSREPAARGSVITAAAYIAACRGESRASVDDAMLVLSMPGLTSRSALTARAYHAMGVASLVDGRNEEAYGHLLRLVTADRRAVHYSEAPPGLLDLAEAARRTKDGSQACDLIEAVFANMAGELPPRLVQIRAACRALLGPSDQAEKHYREALSTTEGEHVPFERARVRLSYGQWLHRQRRDKDARPHLDAAAAVFRRLAAKPWLEATVREQRAAGVRLSLPPSDALSTLSPSERPVVLLAAEGLTNDQIAARLFVSPRTVGSHLYRAFSKLGVSNRSQLTALVSQAELKAASYPGVESMRGAVRAGWGTRWMSSLPGAAPQACSPGCCWPGPGTRSWFSSGTASSLPRTWNRPPRRRFALRRRRSSSRTSSWPGAVSSSSSACPTCTRGCWRPGWPKPRCGRRCPIRCRTPRPGRGMSG